jgi:hypothetical protein
MSSGLKKVSDFIFTPITLPLKLLKFCLPGSSRKDFGSESRSNKFAKSLGLSMAAMVFFAGVFETKTLIRYVPDDIKAKYEKTISNLHNDALVKEGFRQPTLNTQEQSAKEVLSMEFQYDAKTAEKLNDTEHVITIRQAHDYFNELRSQGRHIYFDPQIQNLLGYCIDNPDLIEKTQQDFNNFAHGNVDSGYVHHVSVTKESASLIVNVLEQIKHNPSHNIHPGFN